LIHNKGNANIITFACGIGLF